MAAPFAISTKVPPTPLPSRSLFTNMCVYVTEGHLIAKLRERKVQKEGVDELIGLVKNMHFQV